MGEITFAKVGGPPADWMGLRVFDKATGQEINDVIEVDTVEGYVVRHRRDERGQVYEDPENPGTVATERVLGSFAIRRPN